MFRHVFILTLLSVSLSYADSADDLVAQAARAYAKESSSFNKLKTMVVTEKGTVNQGGKSTPGVRESHIVWPSHYLAQFTLGEKPGTVTVTLCTNGDQGWRSSTGTPPGDLSIAELNEMRIDIYALWVCSLLFLKEGGTKFTAIPDAKVEGVTCKGLLINRRGYPDISLYFDSEKYLLRKASYKGRELGVAKQKELFFSDHKETGGLMLPTKSALRLDGKEVFTWTSIEYTFPDSIDKKKFAKP